MIAARTVGFLVMAVGVLSLARLMTPEEFGLFAIGTSILGVLSLLTSFGLLEWVIRSEATVSRAAVATAAVLNLCLAALAAVTLVAGPRLLPGDLVPVGLAAVLTPLALALLVPPFVLQREAHLHRDIAFGAPSRAFVAGAVCDTAVSVGLALAGVGAAAPAWGLFAGTFAGALALVAFSGGRRVKLARPGRSQLRDMARFGGSLTGVRVLPPLSDLLLITALSAVSGVAATGLYNRASRVRDLFSETLYKAVKPVILPALSQTLRSGVAPDEMIAQTRRRFAPVALPSFLGIALLADPLVALILGDQWEAAVLPVQILALGQAMTPVTQMSQTTFTALDRVNVYARIQAIALTVRVVGGVAMAFVSLPAFCAALALARWLKGAMILRWEARHLGLTPLDPRQRLDQTAVLTLAALAGPAALVWGTALPPLPLVLSAVILGMAGWLGTLRAMNHPLWIDVGATLRRG